MPFTPTHIAGVLPIAALRTRLPFMALAIGSMAPDVALFFPGGVTYQLTHSAWGIVTVCPLIGVCVYVVFRTLMQQPLTALLPHWLQCRFEEPKTQVRLTEVPLVFLATAVGATTHVIWDSFTHADRWGTRVFPWLNSQAFALGRFGVPWFKVLQYGSTFVLLPLMLWLAWRELKSRNPRSIKFVLSLRTKRLVTTLTMLMPVLVGVWHSQDAASYYVLLGKTIKSTIAALLVLSVVFSLVVHAVHGRADGRLRSN